MGSQWGLSGAQWGPVGLATITRPGYIYRGRASKVNLSRSHEVFGHAAIAVASATPTKHSRSRQRSQSIAVAPAKPIYRGLASENIVGLASPSWSLQPHIFCAPLLVNRPRKLTTKVAAVACTLATRTLLQSSRNPASPTFLLCKVCGVQALEKSVNPVVQKTSSHERVYRPHRRKSLVWQGNGFTNVTQDAP